MAQQTVYELVEEAFTNALENGYDFDGWTDEAVRYDMMSYDGYLEDQPEDDVLAAIRQFREKNGISPEGKKL